MDADVCIVGAGYADLTAALRLTQAGKSVVVLEARDRVGGRTWTELLPDGKTWIDRGGAWIGYGEDRIYALAKEMGIATDRASEWRRRFSLRTGKFLAILQAIPR